MRLAHEPADAAGICCVANHTAGLIQDAYGDNRFKEPLDLAFIYESAMLFSLLHIILVNRFIEHKLALIRHLMQDFFQLEHRIKHFFPLNNRKPYASMTQQDKLTWKMFDFACPY